MPLNQADQRADQNHLYDGAAHVRENEVVLDRAVTPGSVVLAGAAEAGPEAVQVSTDAHDALHLAIARNRETHSPSGTHATGSNPEETFLKKPAKNAFQI